MIVGPKPTPTRLSLMQLGEIANCENCFRRSYRDGQSHPVTQPVGDTACPLDDPILLMFSRTATHNSPNALPDGEFQASPLTLASEAIKIQRHPQAVILTGVIPPATWS